MNEERAQLAPTRGQRLLHLAALFLRLGVTAFGGPAAHVAMMETEVVRRRGWMTAERFLDLFGAANIIPGPSSSELAIFIGYEQAGLLGLLVAGTCFILPAALMTGLIAGAYVRFGALPHVAAVLYGIKPVIIAIVVQAIWALAPKAVKTPTLGFLGVALVAANLFGAGALTVLAVGGLVSLAAKEGRRHRTGGLGVFGLFGPTVVGSTTVAGAAVPVTLLGIFAFFLKMGAVVFGSGYVLIAFLRTDLVDRWHWLTEQQLLDAVAVGQVTPGPVFTTATFIGYVLAGIPGAVLATIGIFLPGFVLVAVSRPLIARVRQSPRAGAFLDGVNVAALALMAVVTFQLGRAALVDLPTLVVGLVSAALLLRFKVSSAWLVLGGGVAGIVIRVLR